MDQQSLNSTPRLVAQSSPAPFFGNILIRYPTTVSLILLVLLSILAVAMLAQERAKYIESQRYQLLQILTNYASSLEGMLNSGVVALDSIRSELVLQPETDLSNLDARVALLLHNYPYFRHVAIAPDLVIRYVYPLKGNETVVGVDYRNIPQQLAAIEKTIRLGLPVVAGPVNLLQGGSGLVVRVPVQTSDQKNWGVIAAIIPLESLLERANLPSLQQQYWVGLSGKDGNDQADDLFWGDAELLQTQRVMVDIKLPVGRWQLQASPRHELPLLIGPLQWMALLAAVVIILLCSALLLLLRMAGERERALHTIAFQATYDLLTGLPNRAVFTDSLSRVLKQAQGTQSCLSLMCIDLDEFKQVNESLGHVVGDKLLRAVAERLKLLVGEHDLLARLGGDEFVVASALGNAPEMTELMAEKLVLELAKPVQVGDKLLAVSASIGIAMYPHDGMNHSDLLKHADRAMYAAKQIGRNTYHFYDAAMQKEADRFVHLHNEILKGVQLQQFFLVYQPIYDIGSGAFTKCEALVRWQHPERGLISPLDFISVAERTGAIRPLGHWILQQALIDAKHFCALGLPVQMSVNRSSQEFNVHHVADEWLNMIAAAGLECEQLIFEITESLFMDRISVQQNNIIKLHQHGLQLAIDDFGTGYSALNYLSRYPVNFIKIDKSFIVDVASEDKARALAAVLINMAKVLDVQVVAEGVETKAQLDVLTELGCDFIQGYYFSKPLRADDFIAFVRQSATKTPEEGDY
ncbi:MAG: EAL domain-containing protein [Gammaproteobacteria bacterium]|nr:EAL domain-containing protein [Gammaproteobacteria bacterium]MBU2426163.1 EAL domain-containing protein [Gammaproteobacteria bacterium]